MAPQQVEDAYPLSPVQQGMLFHSVYAPDSGVYVTQVSRILEDVEVASFRGAWQKVVDRHPILRTAFVWKKTDEPLQVVGRHVELPVRVEDWRDLDAQEQERHLGEYLRADRERGFEPSRAPLMRLALFRLEDRRYHLVWSHHHLVLDGWSVPILLGEVMAFYHASVEGRDLVLDPPRPYVAYIEWLQRQDEAAAEEYWRRALAGYSGQPTLPFLGPMPSGDEARAGASATTAVTLGPERSDGLRRLARSSGVTLNTVLRAAWGLCLGRYCGETDVVFGATVSGRPETLPGAERMVGLFLNTLPVRVRVPTERPPRAWLPEIQEQQAEMTDHGHLGLPRIRRLLDLPPEARLFDTLLVFENYPLTPDGGRPRGGRPVGGDARDIRSYEVTNYPLNLLVGPGERLTLQLLFDPDRIARVAARRLLRHLEALLIAMGRTPEAPVDSLSLLGRGERHQVLREWGRPTLDDVPGPPVHRRLAAWAEAAPGRVALVQEGAHLSYGAVLSRARALAARLAATGAGPDRPVALCLRRSPELVVAMLGVIEAGAAYVPIDPASPTARIQFLLEDSGARILLAEEGLAAELDVPGLTLLRPGADGRSPAPGQTVGSRGDQPDPDHVIYLIYTSGSTGRPKGVAVTHGNVARLFSSLETRFGFGSDDTWTLFHSIAFDFSVWELWGALAYGGRLVVVPYFSSRDPREFHRLLARERVTVLNQTPSAFRQLVEADRGTRWDLALRLIVFGGEALDPTSVAAWLDRHGDRDPELVNMYGITETTVHVTRTTLRREHVAGGAVPPVGRAIPDLWVRLVDALTNPVAPGVAGEIQVGGAGLARGYAGYPGLTAIRFIPDAFAGPTRPGARLYRSGDLGRWSPGGEIEYLGRLDHQLKLRGFRVEPGEIEAVLAEHPDVQGAAVVIREDRPGDRRLVAYVVTPGGRPVEGLRDHLARSLPPHMTVAAFVPLEALPLTINGKLDRRALPAPQPAAGGEGATPVPPRTPVEEELAEVWREVLRIEQVGVLDNFFELGGDSILCLQVISRCNRRGIHLTPRHLFQSPTIAGLAAVAEETPTVMQNQEPVIGALPLTPIQAGFFERLPPEPHRFNQAMLFELVEPPESGALRRAVERIEFHHDALRLRFQRVAAEGWSQTCAIPVGRAPFLHLDLGHVEDRRLPRVVETLSDALQGSLDLVRGPLWRVVLLVPPRGRPARLLILIHHLAVDGVSWRVLLEDLRSAYNDVRAGREPELPSKTTSFRVWAHRLRERAAAPEVEAELDYWTDPGRSAVALLPVDRLRGADNQRSAVTATASLTPEETEALLREVPAAYGTRVNDVLLSGLALALVEWTGESSFLVELEGHGREDPSDRLDLSRTVGWFTALFPVWLRVAGRGEDPGEVLRTVKETLRAVPGGGLGHGLLRYLHPAPAVRARIAAQPEPQIVFNYLGQLDLPRSEEDWIRPARDRVGATVSPDARRSHLLLVSGHVRGGRLHLVVVYSANRHRRETVENFLAAYRAGLRSIVAHCARTTVGGFTPSDFPEAELTQGELDELVAQIGE